MVTVRVLIVDGQELFRLGLAAVLATVGDLDVVGSTGTVTAGLELAAATRPDVALIEVAVGTETGADLCQQLREVCPGIKVMVLSASESGTDLYDSVRAGASGYLLKSTTFDELARAIRAVFHGQSMISPTMATKLLDEFKQATGSHPSPPRRLSVRELEVLRLVSRGLNNRDVARELAISENTVKNHVRSILEKLKLRSRTEAAMYAVRENLVPVE